MKLFFNILFLLIIGYYTYLFVVLLAKMRGNIILPVKEEELSSLRKYPQKPVDLPIYSKQKVGINVYALMLVYLVVMYVLGVLNPNIEWTFYLLLFLPLTYSHNLLNVFAVVHDGLISGSSFIPWKKIRRFYFVPIETQHKLYGYSKEANNGYELIIKGRFFTTSCIVTSEEMKEKLTAILSENVTVKGENLNLNECK